MAWPTRRVAAERRPAAGRQADPDQAARHRHPVRRRHARQGQRPKWIDAALASMLQSNRAAARCLHDHGATACTDVTGFGLLGHLVEMARPSGADVELSLDALPLLDGTLDTVRLGIFSSLQPPEPATAPGDPRCRCFDARCASANDLRPADRRWIARRNSRRSGRFMSRRVAAIRLRECGHHRHGAPAQRVGRAIRAVQVSASCVIAAPLSLPLLVIARGEATKRWLPPDEQRFVRREIASSLRP